MKKISFIAIFIIFMSTLVLADHKLTRGPDIGEIYFIGPTVTEPAAIYHSTDFGETATCMDSTLNTNINFRSIAADLTPGVLYGSTMGQALYISYDNGQEGSWIYRNNNIYDIYSGRIEGFIYNRIGSHSENYGIDFIQHSCIGFLGSHKTSEIDIQYETGYSLSYSTYPDSVYLLISYDDFENFEQQYVFSLHWSTEMKISRGFENGELYLYYDNPNINELDKHLLYSSNFGETWEQKNTFNCPCLPIESIVGGKQPGELFILVEYVQFLSTIKHTYIYHSLDYGETFEVYHPFSYGIEPYSANFEATPLEGSAPLTVQFTDFSSGSLLESWEWDFQNDGIVDSYEQHPVYTYVDTGYYSVKLHINEGVGIGEEGYAFRENYIHVTDGSGANNDELGITNYRLNNFPNPFNPTTTIIFDLHKNVNNATIEIYNMKGQRIKKLEIRNVKSGSNEVVWNGSDESGKPVSSGIYFYKLDNKKSPIRKMILIK